MMRKTFTENGTSPVGTQLSKTLKERDYDQTCSHPSKNEANRDVQKTYDIKAHDSMPSSGVKEDTGPAKNVNQVLHCTSGQPAKKKRRKAEKKEGQLSGRWTTEEHQAFLEGLKVHGREWKKVAENIKTRTSAQIRSHAQKYFSKLGKEESQMQMLGTSTAPSIIPIEDQSIASVTPQNLSSSTLEKIERIMTNPSAVEKEVEVTMKALHEKYRQLQLRLEARQRAQSTLQSRTIPALVVPCTTDPPTGPATSALEREQQNNSQPSELALTDSLARALPYREFDNEELIALHVLGSSLKKPIQKGSSTKSYDAAQIPSSDCNKN